MQTRFQGIWGCFGFCPEDTINLTAKIVAVSPSLVSLYKERYHVCT
jgi:hypothetical protein